MEPPPLPSVFPIRGTNKCIPHTRKEAKPLEWYLTATGAQLHRVFAGNCILVRDSGNALGNYSFIFIRR